MANNNLDTSITKHRKDSPYRSPSPRKDIRHTRIENVTILEKQYTFGKQLGKGSFGSVVEALRICDETKWAIKIINKEKAGSAHFKLLEHEVKIMKKVNHRNIIHLEEVFETSDQMFLIMELCSPGGLEEIMQEKGFFPEKEALGIFKQLADAVAYMHANDIIHRDVKIDNILLATPTSELPYFIKLADFGLSYTRVGSGTDYMMTQAVGTPIYMAPEVITNHGYSQQCDIWSIGIVLHTLLSGRAPFCANTEEELHELIKKGELNFSNKRWSAISPAAKQLLENMLKVDPAHRLTSKEVLSQPWMKGEHDVVGGGATNVLEMMKDYREELERNAKMLAEPDNDISSLSIDSSSDKLVMNGEREVKSAESRTTKSAMCIQSPKLAASSPVKKVSSKNPISTATSSKSVIPSYRQPTKSSAASKTSNIRTNKKK